MKPINRSFKSIFSLKKTAIALGVSLATGGVIAAPAVIDNTVNVPSSGQSSPWNIGDALMIGVNANQTGTLNIENGGVVTSTSTSLGTLMTTTGIVNVTGSSSRLTSSSDLNVGQHGTGILDIKNGGSVANFDGYIGRNATGTGTATITGANSRWTNSGNLNIGLNGTGILNIKDGGSVVNRDGFIGGNWNLSGTGTGTAIVTGANSTWTNSNNLYVGQSGKGTLIIENGGAVTNLIGYISMYSGGSTATVTGANSKWTNSSSLNVGFYESGTLNIENGGTVTSSAGFIGMYLGSSTATVTGTNSSWTVSNDLYVGYTDGNGTLEIEAGGKVKSGNTYMAPGSSSSGTINLNGTSSARGLLSTGLVATGGGATAFNWNGGVLQATRNESDFLLRLTQADITIGSEGAFLDTQTFNVGITGAGLLTGTGGLSKLGSGVLTIEGGNTYSGNTTVSAGTLKFNTYTQSGSQTLGIGALSDSVYGKLDVSGTATFNSDANIYVDVVSPSAPALAIGNELINVITAGTLTANGFKVTDNSALFNFQAVQRTNAVDLMVVANSAAGIRDAVIEQSYRSASGAANVLDGQLSAGATGDMGTVINALGQLPNNRDVARAVAQTLPIISGNQAVQGALTTFQKLVQNRNGGSSGATGLSSGDALSNKNAWGKVFGSRAEQDDRSGTSGFKADTWGLALGADAEISPNARFGLAYGYAKTSLDGNTDLAGTAQRASIDSHVISAYGSKDIGSNRTFSFQGDIGVNDNTSTRQINFGGLNRTARADYLTYSAHVGTAIGQAFDLSEKTTLTPSLRADYTWLKSQAYKESGADALNLSVGSNKTDAFVIGADTYLQHRLSTTSRLEANIGIGYDAINERGNIVAAYAGAPGQSFATTGIDHSPWLMRAGIGYSVTAAKGTEINFRYDAEGRSDYLNHTASVRAQWAF